MIIYDLYCYSSFYFDQAPTTSYMIALYEGSY